MDGRGVLVSPIHALAVRCLWLTASIETSALAPIPQTFFFLDQQDVTYMFGSIQHSLDGSTSGLPDYPQRTLAREPLLVS